MHAYMNSRTPFRILFPSLYVQQATVTDRNCWRLTGSKQVIFVTQVLSTVGLTENGNTSRIQSSGLGGASGRDTETEGGIVHVVDYYTLVLGAVFGPSTNVSLDDIASVQEGKLSVGLDPDLPAGVLGNDGEGGDVQAEFASLGELAY